MKMLSSLNLTLWALGAIALCLLIGMILAQVPLSSALVASMNKGLVLDWLIDAVSAGAGPVALAVWFAALCASVGLLVLNLGACTYTRLWPRLMHAKRVHTVLLFMVHALMIVILLGHLSQMTMGFKDESMRLLPGQSVELPDGLSLTLDTATFVDDHSLLNLTYRQGRRAQTTTAFHRELNTAGISLWRDGRKLESGEMRILEPLQIEGLRLTLSDFYLDKSNGSVGAIIAVSGNPLTEVFFAAYLAWIVVYVLLAAMGCRAGETGEMTPSEV